jgi:uncharacterized protein (DUF433 family)
MPAPQGLLRLDIWSRPFGEGEGLYPLADGQAGTACFGLSVFKLCLTANPRTGYTRKKRSSLGNQYVQKRDGGYYVSGTRISLDSVVYAFLRGESPEGIVESFPALRLEQAYGAIAFYLAHRK